MRLDLRAKPKKITALALAWRVLVAVFIIVIGLNFFLPRFLPSVAMSVAFPFWKMRDFIVGIFFDNPYFKRQSSLVEEIIALEEENERLRMAQLQTEILRADNNAFREILGRAVHIETTLYPVVVRPAQAPYDVLVIDLENTEEGLFAGQRIVYGNIALGRVAEVAGRFAKVELYSSSGKETSGILLPSEVPVTLSGRGGGNFVVNLPRDTSVSVGDSVIFSEDGNFVLAQVGSVDELEKEAF